MYYFYILYSASKDVYYKGVTTEPAQRLLQHNNGETLSTTGGRPWTIVFLQQFPDKTTALKRELQVKKWNRQTILNLIASPVNEYRDTI